MSKSEPRERTVPIAALWHALLTGLNPIWPPSRTSIGGISLGDVWPCSALKTSLGPSWKEGDDLVPFHKLTGWTAYSLIEPMQKLLKWKFEGLEDMTGLPEYRNGALFASFSLPLLMICFRRSTRRPGSVNPQAFPSTARHPVGASPCAPFSSCHRRMAGNDNHTTVSTVPIWLYVF